MELTTARLTLVLQTHEDVEQMIAGMSEEERAQVSPEWLARMRASEKPDPWSHGFRAVDRESGAVVAFCLFKGPPIDGVVEIAYGTNPDREGQGYATEMARAMVAYASSRSEVRLIRAHTLPGGGASKRVLAKSGFTYVGEVVDPEDGVVSRFERSPGN